MGMQRSRLKGASKNELRARLAVKRAKNQWHFGPKQVDSKGGAEPVEIVVRRLLFG